MVDSVRQLSQGQAGAISLFLGLQKQVNSLSNRFRSSYSVLFAILNQPLVRAFINPNFKVDAQGIICFWPSSSRRHILTSLFVFPIVLLYIRNAKSQALFSKIPAWYALQRGVQGACREHCADQAQLLPGHRHLFRWPESHRPLHSQRHRNARHCTRCRAFFLRRWFNQCIDYTNSITRVLQITTSL